jgi:hypothetical protein
MLFFAERTSEGMFGSWLSLTNFTKYATTFVAPLSQATCRGVFPAEFFSNMLTPTSLRIFKAFSEPALAAKKAGPDLLGPLFRLRCLELPDTVNKYSNIFVEPRAAARLRVLGHGASEVEG